nr:MAG TPA: hypothetical protein [Caudoviricetes sp.]
MAINDLINEVNSIQTKKQAIKEAITAKGVTSEGKLSKFAEEIKKITTSEPDWYIVNKFRYDNGNEALLIRTSDKTAARAEKYQMVEIGGGVTRSNSISNSFNSYYNDDLGITNGTYFPRETAYRSFTTRDSSSVVFDGHNDNLKLTFNNGKDIVFNDVNAYNWLKGYRNQPLADFNTLYLKSDGINNEGTAKTLKDFLASSLETKTITLDSYGTNPIILIDSSIMIQAMNFSKMSKIGFISYSDKIVDAVSLIPVLYTNTDRYFPFYENKEQLYGNLSPGNYIHLYKTYYFLAVFVSINFVIDSNGQKHKNIEVYAYNIAKAGGGEVFFQKLIDKPFELYLTFSEQAQRQLQQASSIKIFRRQVLAANGTPEPRASNFLTGSDALLEINTSKLTDYSNMPFRYSTTNLFRKNNTRFANVSRYNSTQINGDYIANTLVDDAFSGTKITGFIRLNDNSTTMYPIELENATQEVFGDTKFYKGATYKGTASIFPNGTPNNNKMVVFISDSKNAGNVQAFYVKNKKSTVYIINNFLSTTAKNIQLYLTSDTETQKYLTTKVNNLLNVWTEIQGLNKNNFEAYSEE